MAKLRPFFGKIHHSINVGSSVDLETTLNPWKVNDHSLRSTSGYERDKDCGGQQIIIFVVRS